MNKHEKEREEIEKELGIDVKKDEEVSEEMLEEFKGNKGSEE